MSGWGYAYNPAPQKKIETELLRNPPPRERNIFRTTQGKAIDTNSHGIKRINCNALIQSTIHRHSNVATLHSLTTTHNTRARRDDNIIIHSNTPIDYISRSK